MSIYGRDPWGGPLEIAADSATDDDRSRNLQDFDRAALSRPLDETQQSWLLGPGEQKKKRYVDLGCIIVSRKIFVWTVGTILVAGLIAGFITLIVKTVPRHHHHPPPPDNYTIALRKALMFFNAQRCKFYKSYDMCVCIVCLVGLFCAHGFDDCCGFNLHENELTDRIFLSFCRSRFVVVFNLL